MTDQERDAAALGADAAVDDETGVDDTDEAEEAAAADDAVESVPAGTAAKGAATATAGGGRRNRGLPKAGPAAPSVSEQAVRVDDRASAWFVIALVALFAIVLANALLLGHGGLVSHLLPTPTPIVTPAPTAQPTAQPTAAPTASPSATATPAPTPTPKAS